MWQRRMQTFCPRFSVASTQVQGYAEEEEEAGETAVKLCFMFSSLLRFEGDTTLALCNAGDGCDVLVS